MGSFKEAVFGEVIQEWKYCFTQDRGFVIERCGVALHRSGNETSVVFKVNHKVFSLPNVWLVEVPVRDLSAFVSTLRSNHETLRRLAGSHEVPPAQGPHRIPFAGRLMLRVIYGVKTSRLLLSSRDPATEGDLDIYGFVTRKSETRVLLAPNYVTSNAGWVFSGDALDACLDRLSSFTDERRAGSRAHRE